MKCLTRHYYLFRSTQDGTNDAAEEIAQSIPAPAPAPAPVTHMVSNARGPYPELEMVSVPRNHRRNVSAADNEHMTRRITRRLADVSIFNLTPKPLFY